VLPPIINRTAGRPRNNRIRGEEEKDPSVQRNQKKCGRCGYFGHNSRSCQGGPVASKGRGKGKGRGLTSGSAAPGRGRGKGSIGTSVAGRGRGMGGVMGPIASTAIGGGGGPFANVVGKRTLQVPLPPPATNANPLLKKRKVFYPPARTFLP